MTDEYELFLLATATKTVSEKEEADAEEHCSGHRDRPHSRDNAGVGAPKYDNRRRRIKDFDDPDSKPPSEQDKDLSKNYKSAAKPAKYPSKPPKPPKPEPEVSDPDLKGLPSFLASPLQALVRKVSAISPDFQETMGEKQQELLAPYKRAREQSKPFSKEDRKAYLERAARKVAHEVEIATDHLEKASTMTFSDPKTAAEDIAEAWGIEGNFFARAGIVLALSDAAMQTSLPAAIKVAVLSGAGGKIAKPEAIKALLKPEDKPTRASEDDVKRFVAIVSAHGILRKNPSAINAKDLVNPDQLKQITAQVKAVQDLTKITKAWHDAIAQLKPGKDERVDVSQGDWKAVLGKLNSFMHEAKGPLVDPGQMMVAIAEDYKQLHGEVPREIQAVLEGYGAPLEDLQDVVEKRKKEAEEETLEGDAKRQKRERKDEKRQKKEERRQQKQDKNLSDYEEKLLAKEDKRHPLDFDDMTVSDSFWDKVVSKIDSLRQKVKRKPERKPETSEAEEYDRANREFWQEKYNKANEEYAQLRDRLDELKGDDAKEDEAREVSKQIQDVDDRIVHYLEQLRRYGTSGPGASASYGGSSRKMIKTSAYHGIVDQGHPTDPAGSSPRSYDKRYFGKEHFDSIVVAAKEMLGQDWLKYGWGEEPGDVPVRAALDLAIHTADGGLYQSKIDANTYNMLLNRLAGWDYDMFNETILSGPKTRKATSMAISPAHAILKIADDIRATRPDLAVQIIKNLQALLHTAGDEPGLGHGEGQSTDFEKGMAEEEKKLVAKMVDQVAEQFAKEGKEVSPEQKKQMIDKILKMLEEGLSPKTGDVKFHEGSLLSEAKTLLFMAHVASAIPRYRAQLPMILAAAKKLKDKKGKDKDKDKTAEKKEEAPKPSVPAKKGKDKDKKAEKKDKKSGTSCDKPVAKKRKASVALTVDDVNW